MYDRHTGSDCLLVFRDGVCRIMKVSVVRSLAC